MNHEQIKDWLEAYALGALDAEERAEVERHLATCADCRQRAADYAEIASQLPVALAAASSARPPVALKQTLLDQLETNPTPARTILARALWRWGAVAAFVLLIAAVVWIAQLRTALAEERELREGLEHQTELIFEVVDSNQTSRALLLPPEYDPEVDKLPPYGKVFVRADMPYVVAMTGRIPDAPPGLAYNLWLFGDDNPERAGTMTVNEEGFGSLVYDARRIGPAYEVASLVLQEAGSASPDGITILTTVSPDED